MPTQFIPIKDKSNEEASAPGQQNGGAQSQPTAPAQPVSISGSEAASPDDANGQKSNKPTSSGRFQNLNAYLKANSGVNVANRVNDTLSAKGNELQQNFATAKQNYNQSVDQAKQRYAPAEGTQQNGYTYTSKNGTPGWYKPETISPEDNMGNGGPKRSQSVGSSQTVQNMADSNMQNDLYKTYINQQYLTHPENMSADDIAKFTEMRDASYTGPTQLDQDSILRNQSQDFSDLANQTGTEKDRYSLLRQIYNNPNTTYSQGQQNLDNLLLQSNPQQLAQLQNSKVTANKIQNELGQSIDQSKIDSSNATNQINNVRNNTRGALDTAITDFDTGMGDKVKQAIAEQAKKYQTEQQSLGTGKLTSQEAINFGLINQLGDKGSSMYTLRPQDYLTMNNNYNVNDPNVINQLKTSVAQGTDYTKLNALKGLEGNLVQGDLSKILDTYNNPALAGTFQQQTPYSFNTSKWNTDLGNIANEYQGKIATPTSQIGEATNKLTGDGNLTKNYNAAIAKAKDFYKQQAPYLDPTGKMAGMSDVDFINKYGSEEDKKLIPQYSFETGKLSKAQTDLENLKKMYGVGNMLNITDADKYAPVSIGGGAKQASIATPITAPINNVLGRTDVTNPIINNPSTPNPGVDTPRTALGTNGGISNIITAPTIEAQVNPNLGRQVSVAPAPATVPFSGVLSKLGRKI